ncbi:hypothetical protein PYH66_01445 [Staphylococcus delphini]|uniref:hypothetical protein n=1 Tax=Staphylococcus delphini TaxID=53344 RepID=UPI003364EF82
MKIDSSILKGTIDEFSKGKKDLLINQYTSMISNDAIKQLQMKDESEIINYLIENEFEMLLSAYRKMEYAQSYKYSAIFKIISEDVSDFLISAQLMNTTKGARATLETASSTTIILPILGEIKEIIASNKHLFESSQEGLKILTDYIIELEEESDLPWVSLINKTNNISIKFLFESYTGRDYTLLNYYYHEKRREGMDYVLQSILSEYHQ